MNQSEINLYLNKFKLLSEYDNRFNHNESSNLINENLFRKIGRSLGIYGQVLKKLTKDIEPQNLQKYSNMTYDEIKLAVDNLNPSRTAAYDPALMKEIKDARKIAVLKRAAELEQARGSKLSSDEIKSIFDEVKTKFTPSTYSKEATNVLNKYSPDESTINLFSAQFNKLKPDQINFLAKTDAKLSGLGSKGQIVQSAGNMNQQSFISYYRDYFNAIGITLAMAGLVYWYYNRVYNGEPEQFKTNILPDYSIKSQ
jgi:hypothetical protein